MASQLPMDKLIKLDQSVNHTCMEKLEGRIGCKVSKTEAKSADKWRVCERCSFQLGGNED